MNHATITFEFRGRIHEYDGGLPDDVVAVLPAEMFDTEGFWAGGYPDSLEALMKDEHDTLPSVLWEIEHVGGRVLEVHGARANGAIHWEDWKRQTIHGVVLSPPITYVEPGTPEWDRLSAQWDDEYQLPRSAADALRRRGVPPPP